MARLVKNNRNLTSLVAHFQQMNRIVIRCASERAKTIKDLRGKIGTSTNRSKYQQVILGTDFTPARISSHLRENEQAEWQKNLTKEEIREIQIKRYREAANDTTGHTWTMIA